MRRKTDDKVLHENQYERTIDLDGIPSKTYYYHCNHGFVAWQQRSVDPVAEIKCPFPGCEKLLEPGRAPTGMTVKGHP